MDEVLRSSVTSLVLRREVFSCGFAVTWCGIGKRSLVEQAMRAVCASHAGHDMLDRWLAEGFYEVSSWVKDWSAHPNFPRPEPEYHQACLVRLTDLADWFFRGWHVYQTPHTWVDL